MGKAIDIAGHVFGDLTVVRLAPPDQNVKGQGVRWICQCSCGKEHTARGNVLRLGNVKSCGCKQSEVGRLKVKKAALQGVRFGWLTAIEPTGQTTNGGKVLWACRCDCGRSSVARGTDLSAGNTKSCGCLTGRPAKQA